MLITRAPKEKYPRRRSISRARHSQEMLLVITMTNRLALLQLEESRLFRCLELLSKFPGGQTPDGDKEGADSSNKGTVGHNAGIRSKRRGRGGQRGESRGESMKERRRRGMRGKGEGEKRKDRLGGINSFLGRLVPSHK